jgi:hypothetical protein
MQIVCRMTAVAAMVLAASGAQAAQRHFPDGAICRAAIATLMGRPPGTIWVIPPLPGNQPGVVHTAYVRQDDKTRWETKCQFDRNRVIWATETGRWRIQPDDEIVTFLDTPDSLVVEVRHSGNSATRKAFTRADLDLP